MTHEHKDEIKTIRLSTALWLLGSVLGILAGWYSLKWFVFTVVVGPAFFHFESIPGSVK